MTPSQTKNNKTSDYESGESPTNSDCNSDTDKLHLKQEQSFPETHYHEISSLKRLEQIKEEFSYKVKNYHHNQLMHNYQSKQPSTVDDEEYNVAYLQRTNEDANVWQHPDDLDKNADLLNCLHDWNFPIFRFGERAKKFILSQMACKIFDEIGLFKAFDIPIDKFINFFIALESGYIDLPCKLNTTRIKKRVA